MEQAAVARYVMQSIDYAFLATQDDLFMQPLPALNELPLSFDWI
jgi:hypothetical protein